MNVPDAVNIIRTRQNLKKEEPTVLKISDDNLSEHDNGKFEQHKAEIENEVGCSFEWEFHEDKKYSIIIVKLPIDYNDSANYQTMFNWYCDKAIKMKEVFQKYEQAQV